MIFMKKNIFIKILQIKIWVHVIRLYKTFLTYKVFWKKKLSISQILKSKIMSCSVEKSFIVFLFFFYKHFKHYEENIFTKNI